MCLTTRFPFIKTKKPIFCYKVVREDYKSLHKKFPYKLNELYVLNSDLIPEIGDIFVKDIVPECIWRLGGRYYGRKINNFKYLKTINHGFHAYRTIESAFTHVKCFNNILKLIVVKCVIPEGSTIGINYNEIVSNQIAIIEQVKYDNSN